MLRKRNKAILSTRKDNIPAFGKMALSPEKLYPARQFTIKNMTLKPKKRYTHTFVSVLYCAIAKDENFSSDFGGVMD